MKHLPAPPETCFYPFCRFVDGGSVVATLVRPLVPNFQVQLAYLDKDKLVLSREAMLRLIQLAEYATEGDVGTIVTLGNEPDAKNLEVCKDGTDGEMFFLVRRRDDMNQDTEDEIRITRQGLLQLREALLPVLEGRELPQTLDTVVLLEGEDFPFPM